MTNPYKPQLDAAALRVQAITAVQKAEGSSPSAMGMNDLIYDQLIAINKDIHALYQGLSQSQYAVASVPMKIADDLKRRPSRS